MKSAVIRARRTCRVKRADGFERGMHKSKAKRVERKYEYKVKGRAHLDRAWVICSSADAVADRVIHH